MAAWADAPLVQAVDGGFADVAAALLEAGADTQRDDHGLFGQLVQRAALAGRRDIAELLLKRGAVNDIHTAISLADNQRVQALAAAEPESLRQAPKGSLLPLHFAAICDNVEAARILIEAGAEVEGDSEGYAPLQCAAIFDGARVAALLLERGASPRTRREGGRGYSPLQYACDNGAAKVLRLLFRAGIDLAKDDDQDNPALRLAAEENRAECVQVLLENGADLKAGGLPALSHALGRGHFEPIRILMDRGLDPRTVNKNGAGLMHSDSRNIAFWRLFLDKGADPNLKGKEIGRAHV
jgi:ankyrin repeat protein